MNVILSLHIVGGCIAILAGALAITARKGGQIHVIAGTWFFGSMLLLGATASILDRLRQQPESRGLGGLITCYFVETSWVAARRRDGTTGTFEIAACTLALGTGALMIWVQDVFPEAVRDSPVLFVPAFAPLAVMAFWLVHLRFGKSLVRLKMRLVPVSATGPADQPSA